MLRRTMVALILLCCVAVAPAVAAPAVITQINPNGVGVNFGQLQQAQQGQEFYVYRNGQWVGRIRLVQVGDNSSTAVVVQTPPGFSVNVGDVVSSYPPNQVPALAPAPAPVAPPVPVATPYSGPPFSEMLNGHTRTFRFDAGQPGMPPQFQTSSNLPMYGMMATPLLIGGFGSISPWYAASTGMMVYGTTQANHQIQASHQNTQSAMTVVYWDSALLNAYAASYIATTVSDPVQRAQLQQSAVAQKGVDKNYVFQVQITNKGYAPFQVGPFSAHFFLEDAHGNRLAPRRYDEGLDQSISANGGQVQGYVYFDRYDASGNPTVQGRVHLVIDNFQGAHGKLSF